MCGQVFILCRWEEEHPILTIHKQSAVLSPAKIWGKTEARHSRNGEPGGCRVLQKAACRGNRRPLPLRIWMLQPCRQPGMGQGATLCCATRALTSRHDCSSWRSMTPVRWLHSASLPRAALARKHALRLPARFLGAASFPSPQSRFLTRDQLGCIRSPLIPAARPFPPRPPRRGSQHRSAAARAR